jgi:hypothetical protein
MLYTEFFKSRGLLVKVVDGKLRVSPADLVTEDIVEFMKAHKVEIIAEVRQSVENMTLEEFADAGRAVKVFSEILGEDIYLCSDENAMKMVHAEGLVAYLPDELMAIHQAHPSSEALKLIHEVKKSFNGRVRNDIQRGEQP